MRAILREHLRGCLQYLLSLYGSAHDALVYHQQFKAVHACIDINLKGVQLDVTTILGSISILIFQVRFRDIVVTDIEMKQFEGKPESSYTQDLAVMVFGSDALAERCLSGSLGKGTPPKETI